MGKPGSQLIKMKDLCKKCRDRAEKEGLIEVQKLCYECNRKYSTMQKRKSREIGITFDPKRMTVKSLAASKRRLERRAIIIERDIESKKRKLEDTRAVIKKINRLTKALEV